ncbi:MAG: peptidylprolyl isomerase [Planctomycetaceae bacterium]
MTVRIQALNFGSIAAAILLASTAVVATQPKSKGPAKSPPGAKAPASAKKPDSKAGKTSKEKTQPKSKTLAEWETLESRRRKIGKKMSEMRVTFGISSRADKVRIRKAFQAFIREWNDEIEPKMVPLSLKQLQNDPSDDVAARLAEKFPRQAEVLAVTEKLIKAGKDTGPVLRLAGFANFSMNNFSRAAALLEKARDKDALGSFGGIGVLDGANVLSDAREYVKFWEKERELRKKEAAPKSGQQLPSVVMETERGKVVLELFENEAPNTVANFVNLVERKFYDGQRFHLAHPGRLVATGDPNTKDNYDDKLFYGSGGPGYTIKTEALKNEKARKHFRGSLSMNNLFEDTDGSVFSILLRPEPLLNPGPLRTRGQTVFGRVVSGLDVVEKIKRGDKLIKITVIPGTKRKHPYKPKTSEDPDPPKEPPEKKPVPARKPGEDPPAKTKTAPPKKP